jgi:predicted AAA+ superfamily ATPase
MINRLIQPSIEDSLSRFPVVGFIGPRQCGKTTLARMIEHNRQGKVLFLDLELPADLFKLSDPALFLSNYSDHLVIIDEIQRKPDLFPVLRALIDQDRRPGRFLILGSASIDLLKQSSESLSGRIRYFELGPFALDEVRNAIDDLKLLWLRGGYPLSLLAQDESNSMEWREAFIRTFLERDIPQLGIRIPAIMLRRFWTMLSHVHGGIWNGSTIAGSMGITAPTVRHYLDILTDTFIVRQLPPFHANIGKRLVKSPKVYIRDSGMFHALTGICRYEDLFNHPLIGASWEGWVIEQILSIIPGEVDAFFYRTSAGAEIDLVLVHKSHAKPVAIEIKFSTTPQISRGFFEGFSALGCTQGFVVYPGSDSFEIKPGVLVVPFHEIKIIKQSIQ